MSHMTLRFSGELLNKPAIVRVHDSSFPDGSPLAFRIPAYLPLGGHNHAVPLVVTPEVSFPRDLLIPTVKSTPSSRGVDASDFTCGIEPKFEGDGDAVVRQSSQCCVVVNATPPQLGARKKGRRIPQGLSQVAMQRAGVHFLVTASRHHGERGK